jgi:hypothetical protein
MSMATAIVVLQATLILSNREPNIWVFSLMQHKKSEEVWKNVSKIFKEVAEKDAIDLAVSMEPIHDTPFALCIEQAWSSQNTPEHCRLWHHCTQEIHSIFNGATWNPHLILLVLASIHLVFCFSNTQEHHMVAEHKKKNHHELGILVADTETTLGEEESVSSRIYHFPLSLSLFLLSLLCLIVGLIASNRNHDSAAILDAPTIVISVILFLVASWFLYKQHHFLLDDALNQKSKNFIHDNYYQDDDESEKTLNNDVSHSALSYPVWVQVFHLQLVGVPLTVLMMSVMGVRIYTDVITHFILLSAAVNSLWLQSHLQSAVSNDMILVLIRLFTCGIPLFCIFLAQAQWGGTNTWEQITVFMAFISLSPLYVFTLFPIKHLNQNSDKKWDQVQLRLVNFCVTVAVGSSVINLALL